MTREVHKIVQMAMENGWKLRIHQKANFLLIFDRGEEQMNIWWSKMTVGTIVNHPTGRKQMFRKNVSMGELETLLKKPRTHTGKGYTNNRNQQKAPYKPLVSMEDKKDKTFILFRDLNVLTILILTVLIMATILYIN